MALILAACSSAAPPSEGEPTAAESAAPSAAPSEAPEGLVLVAIGDSIPYNASEDCPGCAGFVDSYAEALTIEIGRPVSAENWSRHDGARTIDILEQLETDERFRDQLAAADVIVMSVGFNDQPPFADAHDGCPPAVNDAMSLEAIVQAGAEKSQA